MACTTVCSNLYFEKSRIRVWRCLLKHVWDKMVLNSFEDRGLSNLTEHVGLISEWHITYVKTFKAKVNLHNIRAKKRLRRFKSSVRWIFFWNYINYNRQSVTTAWRFLRLRMEEQPPIWIVANILNKKSRTADKGWYSRLGLGEVLTTLYRKTLSCYEIFTHTHTHTHTRAGGRKEKSFSKC